MPTCGLKESLADARDRASAAGWDVSVVVNDERVVLGVLRADELAGAPDQPVEAVMRSGPSTFRPHVPIAEMAQYMHHHGLASSPITTSDGRLVGVLRAEDAAQAAHEHRRRGGDEPEVS